MIEIIDSLVSALSLNISNKEDRAKYDEAYTEFRTSLMARNNSRLFDENSAEPVRCNRFIVTMPDDFGIPPWQVNSLILPEMSYNWLGRKVWSPMNVVVINIVSQNLEVNLVHLRGNKKNYPITLQLLDPTGFVVHQMIVMVERINRVNFGFYSMNVGDISMTQISFKVKDLLVNY